MIDKKCSKCGITKPITEFYKCSDNKTKHQSYCKACANKTSVDRVKIRNANIRRAKGIPERIEGDNPRYKCACRIIKKHHETMKDDPERLSTAFIQNLMGRKCK